MSFGSGYENMPTPPGEMLAPSAHAAPGGGGGGGNSGSAPTGVAKCPVGTSPTAQTIADAPGATVLTTSGQTFLVTSYADGPATQALGAALNDHASLAAGLMDGVKRIAIVDAGSS